MKTALPTSTVRHNNFRTGTHPTTLHSGLGDRLRIPWHPRQVSLRDAIELKKITNRPAG
jgi:hypothetical protein